MHDQVTTADVDLTELEPTDFDQFADYEDGDDLVICDRKNPRAWIKSDSVTRIEP